MGRCNIFYLGGCNILMDGKVQHIDLWEVAHGIVPFCLISVVLGPKTRSRIERFVCFGCSTMVISCFKFLTWFKTTVSSLTILLKILFSSCRQMFDLIWNFAGLVLWTLKLKIFKSEERI